VNLASRLENINKIYGTEIIIGEETAKLVMPFFVLRQLDQVRVVGRQQALRIYELLGTPESSLPPEDEKMLAIYASALDAYYQRRWQDAMELFRECLALRPEDGPSRVMGERCRIYQDAPPPEDWSGAFEHLTKD
jgi:adenylate cyclase